MYRMARFLVMATLALIPIASIGATKPLEVVLSAPKDQNKVEAGVVVISVKNVTDRTLLLPKNAGALDLVDGYLMNDVFKVVSDDGIQPAYTGRMLRMSTHELDDRFRRIAPGQTLTSEINLALNYDIKGGNYDVSYDQYFLEMSAWNPESATFEQVSSSTLRIYVNDRVINGVKLLGARSSSATAGDQDQACSAPEQLDAINKARNTLRAGHLSV